MSLFSLSRYLSSSIRTKTPNFSHTTLAITTSAEKYFTHLQKNGPNVERTLNTVKDKLDTSCVKEVLRRCCSLNQPPLLGLRFFIWAGIQPNYRHNSYMYSNACKLFRINQNPSVISDVIDAFRVEDCPVNVKSFKVVLNLCREAKLADEGLWVLKKMKEFNCRPDTTAYNVVIKLLCEKGDMDEAARLMREMGLIDLYPDMMTFIAMVKGFCNVGRLEDALGLFKAMKAQGCLPNVVAHTLLLDGVCRFGSLEKGLELLEEMEREGGDCTPNIVTYTSVIKSFCEKGRSMDALAILARMEACGCSPNKVTVATLITGLCMEERLDEAYKLIDNVVGRSSVTNSDCYSSLVLALFRIEKFEEAEKLFRRMLASALRPDDATSSSLIKWFCLKERVLDAFRLYDEIVKLGFIHTIDSDLYSIMLAGLCQKSHFVEAAKLAALMVEKGFRLKAPYMDGIVEHLKNSGEMELISRISRVGAG